LKKKILVLGSSGLIGHKVFYFLNSLKKYEIFDHSYRKKITKSSIILDARNENLFIEKIRELRPNIIINCIGILINGSKSNPENAIYLNSYLPHFLARTSDEINAKLIHISTDCVFSGNKGSSYVENDYKEGNSVYSKSKGIGEIINDRHLTLRTSVVGPELKSDGEELFHWFMSQSGSIDGYTESIWSGVSTIELARAIEFSIDNKVTGLQHVTNNTSINKYELLRLFKKYTNKNIIINPVAGIKSNKSFVTTTGVMKIKIPSYEKMISSMVQNIKDNKDLYEQYLDKHEL
jgi:dTDP-4-dehydrorhamnose reductase